MKVTLEMRLGAKPTTMETIGRNGFIRYYPAIIFPGTRGKKFFLQEPGESEPKWFADSESAQKVSDRIVAEEVAKAEKEKRGI